MSKKQIELKKEQEFPVICDGEVCVVDDGFLHHKCCDCGAIHLITFDGVVKSDADVILVPLKDPLALRFYRIKDGKK